MPRGQAIRIPQIVIANSGQTTLNQCSCVKIREKQTQFYWVSCERSGNWMVLLCSAIGNQVRMSTSRHTVEQEMANGATQSSPLLLISGEDLR